MSARINDAAEAHRCIDGLHDYQSEEGMSDASMLTVAIEAQVHATLALVEQQRIANIIALSQATVLAGKPFEGIVAASLGVDLVPAETIREALGL